jgi:hypothetical protein
MVTLGTIWSLLGGSTQRFFHWKNWDDDPGSNIFYGWLNHEAPSISSISLCRLNLVLEFLSDTLHRVFDSDRLKEPPDTLMFSPWELLSMEQGPLGTQR